MFGRFEFWRVALCCALVGAAVGIDRSVAGDEGVAAGGRVADARALIEAGEWELARTMLEGLIAAAHDDAETHRLLGEANRRLERWADARRHLREAIRKDETADDRLRMGQVYVGEGKFALALEELERARRLGAVGGDLHRALAEAYLGLGRVFGAERVVEVAGGSAGGMTEDYLLIEQVPGKPDRFVVAPTESAAYQVRRALSSGVDDVEVRLLEAQIWLRGRRYAEAAALFAGVEGRLGPGGPAPRRVVFYTGFAEALFGADDMEGFLARLKQAWQADAGRSETMLSEGYRRVALRYLQRGDLGAYIRHLQLALAEAPRDVDLHYRLGNALWEAGRLIEAAREWRIVLQIAPEHPDRARMLETIQMIQAEYGESRP